FNAPPPPAIYTLSLHDALPICGKALGCKLHWQTPFVQLAREHSRVGDHLSRVGGPELFHLPEDLCRGSDPVPVGIILDPPQEAAHRPLEQLLAVRKEQAALRSRERLVGARAEDIDALQHRLLEFAPGDQAELMGGIV